MEAVKFCSQWNRAILKCERKLHSYIASRFNLENAASTDLMPAQCLVLDGDGEHLFHEIELFDCHHGYFLVFKHNENTVEVIGRRRTGAKKCLAHARADVTAAHKTGQVANFTRRVGTATLAQNN